MNDLFAKVRRAYLDGEFVVPEMARISAFDRGFIFGDGIYEVIPAYGGRAFCWPQHLARLNGNLAAFGIAQPLDHEQWQAVIAGLLEDYADDQYVYVQVTRGVAPRDHAYPADTPPTVFAYTQALAPPAADTLRQGLACVTAEDPRWQLCHRKTTSLIGNVWLRQQAVAQGASEAILLRDGVVTEGAATNVFVVRDGMVSTPPNGPHILPGITRDFVLELLARDAVTCREEPVTSDDLRNADEVWLTSSTKEVQPVTRIDGKTVGDGLPGAVFRQVHDAFQAHKERFRTGQET